MAANKVLLKISINQGLPFPIYQQIKEQLASLIESGVLMPGDKLPSENALTEHLGVSRMTVRQAMQELVQNGLAIRKRGKGTLVSTPKIVQPLFAVKSFTDSMQEAGISVKNQLLKFDIVVADHLVKHKLGLEPSELVIEILRMRWVEDVPVSLQRSYLPFSLAKNLVEVKDQLSEHSLYKLLASYCNVRPASTKETLEIRTAKSPESGLLSIAVGEPLFYIEAVTHSDSEHPIEYVRAFYRGDRFRFALENRL